jgi:hypothetical protein
VSWRDGSEWHGMAERYLGRPQILDCGDTCCLRIFMVSLLQNILDGSYNWFHPNWHLTSSRPGGVKKCRPTQW